MIKSKEDHIKVRYELHMYTIIKPSINSLQTSLCPHLLYPCTIYGLFAIAMAQSLCNNEDPLDKTYMQSDLRGCLKDSIEAGVMKSFTAKQTRRKYRYHTVLHIDIYCKCRDIEEGLMIQCERCNR